MNAAVEFLKNKVDSFLLSCHGDILHPDQLRKNELDEIDKTGYYKSMLKHKMVFITTFLLALLVAPIYVSEIVAGIELGMNSHWQWFGIFTLIRYGGGALFTTSAPSFGHPMFNGDLNLVSNVLFITTVSLAVARLTTLLYVRINNVRNTSMVWKNEYIKSLIVNILKSLLVAILLGEVIDSIIASTGYLEWLFAHTDIRSSMQIREPLTTSLAIIVLFILTIRQKTAMSHRNRALLFTESAIYVLGVLSIFYSLMWMMTLS
jgi:hypothetical protein